MSDVAYGTSSSSTPVVVAIRLKPIEDLEEERACHALPQDEGGVIRLAKNAAGLNFAFDLVFPEKAQNEHVFSHLIEPCCEALLKGIDSAIFAYGGTGSGKSYTMGFELDGPKGQLQYGLETIFAGLKELPQGTSLYLNFVEIYGHTPSAGQDNATVYDLLRYKHHQVDPHVNPDSVIPRMNALRMRKKVSHLRVLSAQEFFQIFHEANAKRQVGGHGFNQKSSRSHGIVQICIAPEDYLPVNRRFGFPTKDPWSKMFFIDLAGSEPAHLWHNRNDAVGMKRYNQAVVINQGLGNLKNVIAALAGKAGVSVVNAAALTRYLSDILHRDSAKGLIRFLCTVNPIVGIGGQVASLTRGTLEYAKEIKSLKIQIGLEKDLAGLAGKLNAKHAPKFGMTPEQMLEETLFLTRRQNAAEKRDLEHQGDKTVNLRGGIRMSDSDENLQPRIEQDIMTDTHTGTTYKGQWRGTEKDGEGTLVYPGNHRYQGQFYRDEMHGRGILSFDNDDEYEGHFYEGNMHGEGKYTHHDGVVYVGQYQYNNRHGHGREDFPTKAWYEGAFVFSNKEGKGTFTWPNGVTYVGDFWDSNRHGEGKTDWADGKTYEGQWVNNKMHGEGVWRQQQPNRNFVYKGQFIDDKRHGYGEVLQNGDIIVGTWREDKPHGMAWVTSKSGNRKERMFDMGKTVKKSKS